MHKQREKNDSPVDVTGGEVWRLQCLVAGGDSRLTRHLLTGKGEVLTLRPKFGQWRSEEEHKKEILEVYQ